MPQAVPQRRWINRGFGDMSKLGMGSFFFV